MIINSKSYNILLDTTGNLNGIEYDYISISMGSIDPLIILFKMMGKKVARIFIGTDVLKCVRFWDYRVRVKFCSLFCDNFAIAEWLISELACVRIKSELLNHENLVLLTKVSPFSNR